MKDFRLMGSFAWKTPTLVPNKNPSKGGKAKISFWKLKKNKLFSQKNAETQEFVF